MAQINLAIIYYSMTGSNYQMAQWAQQAAETAGANVRLRKVAELAAPEIIAANPVWQALVDKTKDVPQATGADLEWADAIIFSTPTRFGNVAAQMKQFFDTMGGLWAQGKLANKVVSAMASTQNMHGGQEQTILQLYTSMYHWGAIIAAPGYTDPAVFAAGGNPYGTSAIVGKDGIVDSDKIRAAVFYQAKRTLWVAEKMAGGK